MLGIIHTLTSIRSKWFKQKDSERQAETKECMVEQAEEGKMSVPGTIMKLTVRP
jgi:hypothetical protein